MQKRSPLQKKVSFDPSIEIIEIPQSTDPATKHRLYYSQWEFLVMQIEAERAAMGSRCSLRRKKQAPKKKIPSPAHQPSKHMQSEANKETTRQISSNVQNTLPIRELIASKHVIAPPA
mmetsp:Transcript_24785/g.36685  ORF Transcript_24785/g.36685 Transcript_24785/m.36685 type:complete len:118 (-) Transcript_24785:152-505(-)